MTKREMKVGENYMSLTRAKEYMAEVLEIVEWGVQTDTIRTYQRRFGGCVCEEGIVVEFEDEETGRTKSANIHYYVQLQPDEHDDGQACIRFGRDEGVYGCTGSDIPFYGIAEDAADFLCGWLAEQWRKEQDENFRLTDEQKRDGYIPHELGVSARKRMAAALKAAARRYALQIERAKELCEKENAKMAKAKACAKKSLKKAV